MGPRRVCRSSRRSVLAQAASPEDKRDGDLEFNALIISVAFP